MTKLSTLSRSIAGRVAIITGAGSGMGRATAYVFSDEDAHLALVDRDADSVEAVAEAVRQAGGTARAYAADLADGDSIPPLVARIRDDLGPVDILVNNAGVSMGAPISHDFWEKAWEKTLAVNLTAQALMIRACREDSRATATAASSTSPRPKAGAPPPAPARTPPPSTASSASRGRWRSSWGRAGSTSTASVRGRSART
jgi:3-oxoacyl-[acyl-carrier protein] reductase